MGEEGGWLPSLPFPLPDEQLYLQPMWLGGSHSRFQFLLSHFAPLLAAGAEQSQDRPRASPPPYPAPLPAAPSSLSPAPSDPPLPQGTQCGKYEFPLSFLGDFRSSSFSSSPLRPPLPPPAATALRPPSPPPGEPAEQRAASPRLLSAPPGSLQPSPPPLAPGRLGRREPMVPGTASRGRPGACLPGGELGPARSRGGAD